MLGQTASSHSRSNRVASFQSTLHVLSTPTYTHTRGSRRPHSHLPPSPSSSSFRQTDVSDGLMRFHLSTTEQRGGADYMTEEAHPPSEDQVYDNRDLIAVRPLQPLPPLDLEEAQQLQLFEYASPIVFGCQHAPSSPSTSIPVCSTPILSKSPESPSTNSSLSTPSPSQHTSLPNLDLLSCKDLIAFHREALASRRRASAVSSLSRSNSYRPMPANAIFVPSGINYLRRLNPAHLLSNSSQPVKHLSAFQSPSPEAPKSAPPLSGSETRKRRRQGIDFHSHAEYAKFDWAEVVESKTELTPTGGKRLDVPEETRAIGPKLEPEPEFESEDYSWEAEEIIEEEDDGSADLIDILNIRGSTEYGPVICGVPSDHERGRKSLGLHNDVGSPIAVLDDVFCFPVTPKDSRDKVVISSVSSVSQHSRPTLSRLQTALPTIIEPSRPSGSPMDPFDYHDDEPSLPMPHDDELFNLGFASQGFEDTPRSAFESDTDSDSCSDQEMVGRPRTRRSHRTSLRPKPSPTGGKLWRIKNALKGSVSMPSVKSGVGRAKNTSRSVEPTTPISVVSEMPPRSTSLKSSVSRHVRTESSASRFSINSTCISSGVSLGESSSSMLDTTLPIPTPIDNVHCHTPRACNFSSASPCIPDVEVGSNHTGENVRVRSPTRFLPRPRPKPNIPLPPLPLPSSSISSSLFPQSPQYTSYIELTTPVSETTHGFSGATVDVEVDKDDSRIMLEKSLAKLKEHGPTYLQRAGSSCRTAVPHDLKARDSREDATHARKRSQTVVEPDMDEVRANVGHLDVQSSKTDNKLGLDLSNISTCQRVLSSESTEKTSSSEEKSEWYSAHSEPINPFLIPPFDFEKHSRLSNGSKRRHIRRSSSLSSIARLVRENITRFSGSSNSSSSTSSASSSSSPMSNYSSPPHTPVSTGTLSSVCPKPSTKDSVRPSATNGSDIKNARSIPLFLYRPVKKERLALLKGKPKDSQASSSPVRPTRIYDSSRDMPLLPEEEVPVIRMASSSSTSKEANSEAVEVDPRPQSHSKVRKLFGRVGNTTEKRMKGLRGSFSIRN